MSAGGPRSGVRVVVAGAHGRMGRLVVGALESQPDIILAGTLVRGQDPEPLLDPARADVLLDLTLAECSRTLAPRAAERGLSPVVGTSGLLAADVELLAAACAAAGVGGLLVPNFSLGAVLQMQACEALARWLPCTGIREEHHPGKRDAPSGTARATAERIACGAASRAPATPGSAATPAIESIRREGVVANQRVVFGNAGETLVLEHQVTDRRAYLPGIWLALRQVRGLSGLVRGLDGLLAP